MIKVKDLLKDLDYTTQVNIGDVYINNCVSDSRLVEEKDLFVAIRGTNKDGHNFIQEALKRGASVIIVEEDVDIDNFKKISVYPAFKGLIKVKDTRKALALSASNFYQNPSKKIKMIGITGTNGKTTVSYLLESIFKKAGLKTGLIGTIKYQIDGEEIAAVNTTPSPLILQNLIKRMVDHSLSYCIMEVSSHALDQHRADYIDFDVAIFTNATREHLDYHKNFANYLSSKARLFKTLRKDGIAIINRDDPNFNRMRDASFSKKILSFSLKDDADIYADNIESNMDGTRFVIHVKKKRLSISSHLIGEHNIYNMLAAASTSIGEGIDLVTIKKGLEDVRLIPGRLQLIEAQNGLKIFVDYAHTDDALEKVLSALNRLRKNRIITVFGCGGNRDREKRPRMGEVAARLSDYVIITSDNPRDEDPVKIAEDITKTIDRSFKNFKVILDRRKAIEEALSIAEDGDIVLLAGKGHEKYQIIKDNSIPFDDVEVAKEILESKRRCLI